MNMQAFGSQATPPTGMNVPATGMQWQGISPAAGASIAKNNPNPLSNAAPVAGVAKADTAGIQQALAKFAKQEKQGAAVPAGYYAGVRDYIAGTTLAHGDNHLPYSPVNSPAANYVKEQFQKFAKWKETQPQAEHEAQSLAYSSTLNDYQKAFFSKLAGCSVDEIRLAVSRVEERFGEKAAAELKQAIVPGKMSMSPDEFHYELKKALGQLRPGEEKSPEEEKQANVFMKTWNAVAPYASKAVQPFKPVVSGASNFSKGMQTNTNRFANMSKPAPGGMGPSQVTPWMSAGQAVKPYANKTMQWGVNPAVQAGMGYEAGDNMLGDNLGGAGRYAGTITGAVMGSPLGKFIPKGFRRQYQDTVAGSTAGSVADYALGTDFLGTAGAYGGAVGRPLMSRFAPNAAAKYLSPVAKPGVASNAVNFARGTAYQPGTGAYNTAGRFALPAAAGTVLGTAAVTGQDYRPVPTIQRMAGQYFDKTVNNKIQEMTGMSVDEIKNIASTAQGANSFMQSFGSGIDSILSPLLGAENVSKMNPAMKLMLLLGGGMALGGMAGGTSGALTGLGGGLMLPLIMNMLQQQQKPVDGQQAAADNPGIVPARNEIAAQQQPNMTPAGTGF